MPLSPTPMTLTVNLVGTSIDPTAGYGALPDSIHPNVGLRLTLAPDQESHTLSPSQGGVRPPRSRTPTRNRTWISRFVVLCHVRWTIEVSGASIPQFADHVHTT